MPEAKLTTYKAPSKKAMEVYRRTMLSEQEEEGRKEILKALKNTWLIVVCPSGHLSAVPFGITFRCGICSKIFSLLEFQEKRPVNHKDYFSRGNWRGHDSYWFDKEWRKAVVYQSDLTEGEAKQLLEKLRRNE